MDRGTNTNLMDSVYKRPPRIVGFDVARALAIAGMVLVNFTIAFSGEASADSFLGMLVSGTQGRAAALFVTLAGVGASLGSVRAWQGTTENRRRARVVLLKRALLLLIIGYAWVTWWTGDILHFYAVYLTIGAALLFVRNRWLLPAGAVALAAWLLFFLLGDPYANWDFITFQYQGRWGFPEWFQELFFDGLHPVFPWICFYIFGMWLGRLNWRDRGVRIRVFVVAALVALVAEIVGLVTVGKFFDMEFLRSSLNDSSLLFATMPLPPSPFYLLAAGGTAAAVLSICVTLSMQPKIARLITPLVSVGQLALSVYLLHVLAIFFIFTVYFAIVAINNNGVVPDTTGGPVQIFSLGTAVFISAIFVVSATILAWLWRLRYRRGPAERVMRRFSDSTWRIPMLTRGNRET